MQHLTKWILPFLIIFALGCQAEQDSGQISTSAAPPVTEAQPVTQASDEARPVPSSATKINYEAGTHYEVLPQPVPTADPSKIEVAEIFWYGCGHCYDFEPLFEAWIQNQPEDVAVVRSPAMWDQQGIMERHARIYYTAKALGVLDKLHTATFEAMNLHRNQLESEEVIAKLFLDNGVSREDFDKTFNSFGVTSAVKQAESRLRGYRTQGTPEIVVNGTYRVSSRMTGGHQGMLDVTTYLIDKIRSEKE